jgi:hypothetical protein
MGRINYTHALVAILIGALLMHLYRTKTSPGKKSGQ